MLYEVITKRQDGDSHGKELQRSRRGQRQEAFVEGQPCGKDKRQNNEPEIPFGQYGNDPRPEAVPSGEEA